MRELCEALLKFADRDILVVLAVLYCADFGVVAVGIIDLNVHRVADFFAEQGFSDGALLADKAVQGVLAKRGDETELLLLPVLLDPDRDLIEELNKKG